VTDEINAKLAFMNFDQLDKSRAGEETFDKKLQRVFIQLNVLKSLIDQKQLQSTNSSSKETINPATLLQVEQLQGKLAHLLSNNGNNDSNEPDSSLKPIIKSLGNLTKNSENPAPNSDNVTYELMYNKDTKNILVASKLSELKKRLDVIQKCLSGYNTKKYKSIGEMLRNTEEKLKIMTSEKQMTIIRKKASAMFNKMFNIQESKTTSEIQYETGIISELHEIVKNVDEDMLQTNIERIDSLKNVHEESALVLNRVKQMQDSQSKLLEGLKDDQKALNTVKDSFKDNIQIMKDNLQNIKDRISKLSN
jgi:hypothetical protein